MVTTRLAPRSRHVCRHRFVVSHWYRGLMATEAPKTVSLTDGQQPAVYRPSWSSAARRHQRLRLFDALVTDQIDQLCCVAWS